MFSLRKLFAKPPAEPDAIRRLREDFRGGYVPQPGTGSKEPPTGGSGAQRPSFFVEVTPEIIRPTIPRGHGDNPTQYERPLPMIDSKVITIPADFEPDARRVFCPRPVAGMRGPADVWSVPIPFHLLPPTWEGLQYTSMGRLRRWATAATRYRGPLVDYGEGGLENWLNLMDKARHLRLEQDAVLAGRELKAHVRYVPPRSVMGRENSPAHLVLVAVQLLGDPTDDAPLCAEMRRQIEKGMNWGRD